MNESELVDAWFTPPIDFEKVKERIGLNGEYEEYAIHDYELPFEIGEYTQISEVNHLCEMVMELEGSPMMYFQKFKVNGLVAVKNCWEIRTIFRTFFIISHCNSILFSCTLKDLIFLNPCDK